MRTLKWAVALVSPCELTSHHTALIVKRAAIQTVCVTQ